MAKTAVQAAQAELAPEVTREVIHVLQPKAYALGESDKMTGSWTNPKATPGRIGVDIHGPDMATVLTCMGREERVTLPDGRVRFLADTQQGVYAIQTALQAASRFRQLTIEEPVCIESTAARAVDAVRGPEDVGAVASVENRNFPLLAIRPAKPTPVVLETTADGKRRIVIDLD